MAYEKGGRADKLGNRYEGRYFIYTLLQVLNEKILSTKIEPLGDDEIGTDIVILNKNNIKEFQQCKGRNISNLAWSVSNLKLRNILQNFKFQLERDNTCYVALISPLHSNLDDLLNRVKSNSGIFEEFYNYQIKDKSIENDFTLYCETMNLNYKNELDQIKIIDFLKRTKIIQQPDSNMESFLKSSIDLLFINNSEEVYSIFLKLLDGDIFGKEIDYTFLTNYLDENNIRLRNLASDKRIQPRIDELNKQFKSGFNPIDNKLLIRKELDNCKSVLKNSNSAIIHGKAGIGKSGLVLNLINYCEQNDYPYIAIKLDSYIPKNNTKQWANNLGLPDSISYCMDDLYKSKSPIIILDQLDILRWTQNHSTDSLQVCIDLINEIKTINLSRSEESLKPISIFFVCRTFDLENDNSIQSLFIENEKELFNWKKIKVNELSDDVLKDFIGDMFGRFSDKLKSTLAMPSNLFIFKQLKNFESDSDTTNKLIEQWWNQIISNTRGKEINPQELEKFKNYFVDKLYKTGLTKINPKKLDCNPLVLEYLIGNNILFSKNNTISFTHQSILDYFIVDKVYKEIYIKEDILSFIGNIESQTPIKRYQLQMLLEIILDDDIKLFLKIGEMLLEKDNIRYYNKYLFFEILGQYNMKNELIDEYILNNVNHEIFGNEIYSSCIFRKIYFIELLINNGILDEWYNDSSNKNKVFNLLSSVYNINSSTVLDFIEKSSFIHIENDKNLFYYFHNKFHIDSNKKFELRLKFYEKYPDFINIYDFTDSIIANEDKFLEIYKICLKNHFSGKTFKSYFFSYTLDELEKIVLANPKKIASKLIPFLPDVDLENPYWYYDWRDQSYSGQEINRSLIDTLKIASSQILNNSIEEFIDIFKVQFSKKNYIYNEIILYSFLNAPLKYGDNILNIIIDNFNNLIFDETSNSESQLTIFAQILEKLSKNCSESVFKKLEEKIINYKDPKEFSLYKFRLEKAREFSFKDIGTNYGDLQINLIPYLSTDRRSKNTNGFYNILQRKFENKESIYIKPQMQSGSVSSPVYGKNLSINSWKNIITNKDLRFKKTINFFVDNSVQSFASSFNYEVQKKPLDMLDLVLENSNVVLSEFIDALFSGLSFSKEEYKISHDKLDKLIRTFNYDYKSYRAGYICDLIYKNYSDNFNESILEILNDIALNHENYKITYDNDFKTDISSLNMESLNSSRGKAITAMARCIHHNKQLHYFFKETIKFLLNEDNIVVDHTLINYLINSYNIDKDWAEEKLIYLLEKYDNFIGNYEYNNIRIILYNAPRKYKKRINDIILQGFNSEDKSAIEYSSYMISELYILNDDFNTLFYNSSNFSEEQLNSLIRVLVNYIDHENEVYSNKSKQILIKINSLIDNVKFNITRIFFDNKISVENDYDFIKEILNSRNSSQYFYYFIEWTKENNYSLYEIKDILFILFNKVTQKNDEEFYDYSIREYLPNLIINLYNELLSKNASDTSLKCLDYWDLLFKNNIIQIRQLSRNMNNM